MQQTTIDFLQKREERHLSARALGASDADIARFERVATAFGPRTMLPNSEAYDAIWFVGKNCLAQGRPLIPTNAERWAGEVWMRLCQLSIIRSWEVAPLFEIRTTAMTLWGEIK
jgi:hypothetical protein